MNEIDTTKPSRELDAWIAREIFKLDVVGEARCRNYDGSGWSIVTGGWSASELDRYPIRPVHVGHCICDLNGLDDVPMFGHFWGCLEIVKWYTTDDSTALAAVHRFLSTHAGYGFALRLDWHGPEVAMSGYAWASFVPHDPKFGAYARTVPLAICKAIHKVLTSPDEAPQS